MPFLDHLFSETVRKIQDFRVTGRPLPPWLQRQAEGMFIAEKDLDKGFSIFGEGLQQERDRYAELDNDG